MKIKLMPLLLLIMLSYSGLHAQESFFDSVNRTSEKLIELNRVQEKMKRLEKDHKSETINDNQQNKVGPYNFTIEDALGEPSLNSDPVVQRARAAEEEREAANTVTSTSTIESPTKFVTDSHDTSHVRDDVSWVGFLPIILGIVIWFFWARGYNKGLKDPMKQRMVYNTAIKFVPWILALILIGGGVYLLAQ